MCIRDSAGSLLRLAPLGPRHPVPLAGGDIALEVALDDTALPVDRRSREVQPVRTLRSVQPLRADLRTRTGARRSRRLRQGRHRILHRKLLDLLLDLDLQVEQVADGLLLDAVLHGVEHVEALALVLDQRVLLGHRPQADALLQVVHLVQVLAPLAVEDRQDHAPLQLTHDLGAEGLLARLVLLVDVVLDGLRDELGGDARAVARGLFELLDGDLHRVELPEGVPQALQVPLLGEALDRLGRDVRVDRVVHHEADLLLEVLALQDAAALAVDDLTLAVEDLVVLQDVLARLEVLGLDLRLGRRDRARHHLVLDRHVVGDVGHRHDALDHLRLEQAHQVVAQRQVEAGLARVALSAGAAAQLVVDTARLVALGAQHVQPAEVLDLLELRLDRGLGPGERGGKGVRPLLDVLLRVQALLAQLGLGEVVRVAAELDVGTTAGHVRGDGDGAPAAGLGDDRRLTVVLLGVEHLVRDAALGELLGEVLGLLDRRRTDEDRLALLVLLRDVVDDGGELRDLGPVDQVRLVLADHVAVGRDRDDTELVDLVELGGLGHGRTGHARQLRVEAEEVLQGDRGEGLVLVLDVHPFLRLDRLVHALVVAAAREDTAGVLVDDHDFAVDDDVVLVGLEELLGLDRVVEVTDERGVHRLVEVLDAEPVLDLGDTGLVDGDGALLLVDLVVAGLLDALQRLAGLALGQAGHQLREVAVPLRGLVGRAGDDQRGTGLVDQDRVDLVDHGEVVAALDELVLRPGHVVAQVVEAELVVRAVGDVGVVLLAALRRRHVRQDAADLQAEELVHPAHQLGVALGEVVVHRDQVDALAGQRVQVRGQRADEGLALTGLHLGDVAEVQRRATHDLDVVVALAEDALGGLADGREGLGQQVVQALAVLEALLVLVRERPQLGVGEVDEVLFDGVDLVRDAVQFAQDLAFACTHELVEDGHRGLSPCRSGLGTVRTRARQVGPTATAIVSEDVAASGGPPFP